MIPGLSVLDARAVGIEAWSVVLPVFGRTVVVCRVAFAKLPDRVASLGLAAAALGTSAAGSLMVGAVQTPARILGGTIVLSIGTAFLTPAVFAGVFSAVPAQRGNAATTTTILSTWA